MAQELGLFKHTRETNQYENNVKLLLQRRNGMSTVILSMFECPISRLQIKLSNH